MRRRLFRPAKKSLYLLVCQRLEGRSLCFLCSFVAWKTLEAECYEAAIRSAIRSDNALIVAEGLTLNAVGMIAPSDT
jgi:hypothetical protein